MARSKAITGILVYDPKAAIKWSIQEGGNTHNLHVWLDEFIGEQVTITVHQIPILEEKGDLIVCLRRGIMNLDTRARQPRSLCGTGGF